MAGTHGDLISEIGKLVVAAHAGQPIDLAATSEELASRYAHLGVPADGMARAIARSLSAVSVSMALMARDSAGRAEDAAVRGADGGPDELPPEDVKAAGEHARSAASLFPSGVRLAVLS
jgi:hypothetical protein